MAEDAPTNSIAKATRTVALLTLLSRVFGLGRDLVTVRLFGDTLIGSAFVAAFAIPNLFRRMLGEGALSAAFIPRYTRLTESDKDLAQRYASLMIAALVLVTSVLLVAGESIALSLWFTSSDPAREMSFKLIAVLLPYMPLVCVTAILGGMLQVHGRFLPMAAAPIILNVCIIAATAIAMMLDIEPERAAVWIGVSTLIAGVLQLLWALLELRKHMRWRLDLSPAREEATKTLKKFLPVLIGLGTLQLNTLADTVIAMWPTWIGPTIFGQAVPMDEASNAVLGYTQRLYQFPLGVFGIAVATAAFPALARAASDKIQFSETVAHGLRLSLFIGLPATVGLILVREDFVRVMFSGGGGFSDEGLARSSAVLAGYAAGVFAYSLNHVLSRSFYALDDTTTPMRIGLVMVAVNMVCNLVLIWSFREAGLAWATAISAIGQTLCLALLLRRRMARGARLLPGAGRTVLLSIVMGAAVWGVLAVMPDAQSWSGNAVRLASGVAAGIALYIGLSVWMKSPEIRWLVKGT
jgi:putative peptidoglycan lipid II flippase